MTEAWILALSPGAWRFAVLVRGPRGDFRVWRWLELRGLGLWVWVCRFRV